MIKQLSLFSDDFGASNHRISTWLENEQSRDTSSVHITIPGDLWAPEGMPDDRTALMRAPWFFINGVQVATYAYALDNEHTRHIAIEACKLLDPTGLWHAETYIKDRRYIIVGRTAGSCSGYDPRTATWASEDCPLCPDHPNEPLEKEILAALAGGPKTVDEIIAHVNGAP